MKFYFIDVLFLVGLRGLLLLLLFIHNAQKNCISQSWCHDAYFGYQPCGIRICKKSCQAFLGLCYLVISRRNIEIRSAYIHNIFYVKVAFISKGYWDSMASRKRSTRRTSIGIVFQFLCIASCCIGKPFPWTPSVTCSCDFTTYNRCKKYIINTLLLFFGAAQKN